MKVKLISVTPDAEKIIAHCARVSNPDNQSNPDYAKLLAYCIKHKHWSIFEHASMTLEIETSRGIATQILRHRSATFQEFSQRYAAVSEHAVEIYPARRQDLKNKQNSIDDLSDETKEWFEAAQRDTWRAAQEKYQKALELGIAKEQARFLLPLNTKTTMYMTNNLRNWMHYIELRSAVETQLEHREIAIEAKRIFAEQFPIIAKALAWI